MSQPRFKFTRKQACPCGKSKSFQPICGSKQGGKCWSQKCKQKFFNPEPGYKSAMAQGPYHPNPQQTLHSPLAGQRNIEKQLSFQREHVYTNIASQPTDHGISIVPYMRSVVFRSGEGKVVIPYHFQNGAWMKGLNKKPRIPYKLPETLKAISEDRVVLILEGEKDVDSAERYGIAATTNMLGVGKWDDDHSAALAGICAVIVPDNDDAGRNHAQLVRASLIRTKACTNPVILDLTSIMPSLPIKGDLSDYLELGGSIDTLKAMISQLQNSAHCDEAHVSREDAANNIAAPIPLPIIDYSCLPSFISEMVHATQGESHKVALLASIIAVCSAIMPTVYTSYSGKEYYPMLYIFIVGKAASGKSCINPALKLIQSVLQSLDREYDSAYKAYRSQLRAYERVRSPEERENNSQEEPEEPVDIRMLIHADSTAPLIINRICTAPSSLIFDTEADSLSTALGEYGDASSTFRKCWEHEPIGKERITSKRVNRTDPKLAVVIAGTHSQVKPLVKHVENGLLSRFAFIEILPDGTFQDKFAEERNVPREIAEETTPKLLELWNLIKNNPVKVVFTKTQQQRFRECFDKHFTDEIEGISIDITTRSAIIVLRMAMVLSVLKHWEEHSAVPKGLECNNLIFDVAMKLADYCRHVTDYIRDVISPLSTTETPRRRLKPAQLWFQQLPPAFTTSEALSLGDKLGTAQSTVYRWLSNTGRFTLIAAKRYRKVDSTNISQNIPP